MALNSDRKQEAGRCWSPTETDMFHNFGEGEYSIVAITANDLVDLLHRALFVVVVSVEGEEIIAVLISSSSAAQLRVIGRVHRLLCV